jgi:hypothetical protein
MQPTTRTAHGPGQTMYGARDSGTEAHRRPNLIAPRALASVRSAKAFSNDDALPGQAVRYRTASPRRRSAGDARKDPVTHSDSFDPWLRRSCPQSSNSVHVTTGSTSDRRPASRRAEPAPRARLHRTTTMGRNANNIKSKPARPAHLGLSTQRQGAGRSPTDRAQKPTVTRRDAMTEDRRSTARSTTPATRNGPEPHSRSSEPFSEARPKGFEPLTF